MLLGVVGSVTPPNFGGGTSSGGSGVTWVSNDGQWSAEEGENNKFTITRWDGWVLEYRNGRIYRMTTDGGKVLGWGYDENNPAIATRVYDVATGNDVITLGVSDKVEEMIGAGVSRGAHTITVNGDTYSFKYDGGRCRKWTSRTGGRSNGALRTRGWDESPDAHTGERMVEELGVRQHEPEVKERRHLELHGDGRGGRNRWSDLQPSDDAEDPVMGWRGGKSGIPGEQLGGNPHGRARERDDEFELPVGG